MRLLDRFKRNKSDNSGAVPTEIHDYYQAERRDRTGVAWLLAAGTLIGTVLIVLGLFFGGRWAYRALTGNNKPNAVTQTDEEKEKAEQEAERQRQEQQKQEERKKEEEKKAEEERAKNQAATPQPASPSPTPAPTPGTQPATGDASLPRTGPDADL